MKSTMKKYLKGIVFLAIFALLFVVFQNLLQAKWLVGGKDSNASTSTFTEYESMEENTLDALFIGTSHVYCGIDPMYIYEQTGIASHVMTGPGLRVDLSYLTLKHALNSQTPKVVMMDASAFHYKSQQTETKIHMISDYLPFTWEKVEFAFHSGNEELDPMGTLFPLFRYHSRWDDLKREDLEYITGNMEKSYVRGHRISFKQTVAQFNFESTDEQFKMSERDLQYFDKIVNLCREKGVTLVVCKVPTPDWNITYSQAVSRMLDERNIPYMELYYQMDAIGINTETDYSDATDHLNQHGAEKLSLYLAEYLKENFGLPDHRGEYTRWDEDIEKYHAFLEEEKKKQEEKLKKQEEKRKKQMEKEKKEE